MDFSYEVQFLSDGMTAPKSECDLPVTQRSSHAIVAVNETVYLIGGEQEPRTPADPLMCQYDMGSDRWSVLNSVGDVPPLRVAPGYGVVDSCFYLFGGRTESDMHAGNLSDLYRFDTRSHQWSCLKPKLSPPERSFSSSCSQGTKFFVFGGCSAEGRLKDLWEFDGVREEWTRLTQPPAEMKARGGALLLAAVDCLLVIGGFSGEEMSDVWRYDLFTGTWSCLCQHGKSNIFTPRSVLAGRHFQSHTFIFGGEIEPSSGGHESAGKFTNTVLAFDAYSSRWHQVKRSSSSTPVSSKGWLAHCRYKDGLLIHGGLDEFNDRLSDLALLKFHAL